MSWYDKGSTPQWKTFIAKPYTIQGLLLNRDVLLKDIPHEKQIQNYFTTHREQIVTQALQFCLKCPPDDASYDRKFLFPTKAIDFMTNEVWFNSLGWDHALVKKYFHLLMKNFLSGTPQTEISNLYHGYFQRLLKMITRIAKFNRVQLVKIIQQEQKAHNFVSELIKHIHKYSIVTCYMQFLTMDFNDANILVSLDIKKAIINKCFECLQSFAQSKDKQEPQKVENVLILLKIYTEESIKFLMTPIPTQDPKVVIVKEIYSTFQQKYYLFVQMLKNEETCLKITSLQFMNLSQILLLRVKGRQIDDKCCQPYREEIINYVFSQQVGIMYPTFIEWLIIYFSDSGENFQKIQQLIKTKTVEKILKVLFAHKNNNILVFRIIQFLKVVFMNIQKQILLSIELNKTKNPNQIQFRLFNQFFANFPTIESAIRQFKNYNQTLFTTLLKFIKSLYQFATNIEGIFSHYRGLPACEQHKSKIVTFIEFYHKEQCFQVYQHDLSKELGTFFDQSVFQNLQPSQYTVKKPLGKQVSAPKPLNTSIIVSDPHQLQSLVTNAIAAILPNENEKSSPLTQIENTLVQIKLNPKENKNDILQESKGDKIKSAGEIKATADVNNGEETVQDTYESYMKKRLKEADKEISERRSKSRTPTKLKNDIKKSKNKWGNIQQSEQSQKSMNRTVSCENINKNNQISSQSHTAGKVSIFNQELPDKVELIKLGSRRMPREYKTRLLDLNRDSRLCQWLKLLRGTR